jgi:serine protease AprX
MQRQIALRQFKLLINYFKRFNHYYFDVSQKIIRHIFLFELLLIAFTFCDVFAQKEKYWVFFSDKGFGVSSSEELQKGSVEYQIAESYLDKQALIRRAKTLPANKLIDADDLPIYEPYIKAIESAGGVLARESRWLNAASFYLTKPVKNEIEKLFFVRNIRPVIVFRGRYLNQKDYRNRLDLSNIQSLDYGYSANQLNIINIPALHSLGITGKRVRVGLLDSGFRWRLHEALKTRRVIDEHDFIFNDNNTANESNDSKSQDAHGTLTFSIIAGYQPGKLIGGSFDSDFLLGKTEYIPSETRQEEDNWAAALEWMERLGVDVVSSSVGYDFFDDATGYFWANGDFNGKTSVVAQAATRAAKLGVLVCSSMGNNGNGDGIEGTLLTPADADSIISVGGIALDKYDNPYLWSMSSTGPTNDGRIKPDVVALSEGVYHAITPGPATYGSSSGNSVSTPLVASASSLILSCRPELTPIQVRDALRETARHIDNIVHPVFPNNFLGWGLIDALRAATFYGPIFGNEPIVTISTGKTNIAVKALSYYGLISDSILLRYSVNGGPENILPMRLDSSFIYPTSGKYFVEIPSEQVGAPIGFYITAVDSARNFYQTPSSFIGNRWWIYYGIPGLQPQPVNNETPLLEQNFPNPFYSSGGATSNLISGNITIIPFQLHNGGKVVIKVFNLLGEEVAELANGIFNAGRNFAVWNATNFPAGVYFYRFSTSSVSITKKMVFIR